MEKGRMTTSDYVHIVQLLLVVVSSTVLILFAHDWIPPAAVYTGMIAMLGGVVASRTIGNTKDG